MEPAGRNKEEIKRVRTAIVVEGEIDLISLWQAGFKNVVAIKGTALTMEQVQMLAKICDRVILALDSDFAGNQAAKRGIEIAQKENLQIDVLVNKNYKDPDEFVRKDIKGLRVALNNTLSIWDFLLNNAFENVGVIKSSEDKVRAGNLVAPILKSIVDPIALADYVKKVAKRLEVSENAIRAKIGGIVEDLGKNFEEENKQKIESNRYNTLEKKLLSLAFEHDPELLLKEEIQNLIVSRNLRILVKNFLAYATENQRH